MLTKAGIEQYFVAQKQAGLVFLLIGLAAILVALASWFYYKTPFWRGAALPLLVIGLMQVAAGYIIYRQSDPLRISAVYALDMNPLQLKEQELPRMYSVQQRFNGYRVVQWILLGAGIGLLLLFRRNPDAAFWYGLGSTLALQAAVLLIIYYFAWERARIYTAQLESFVQQF